MIVLVSLFHGAGVYVSIVSGADRWGAQSLIETRL